MTWSWRGTWRASKRTWEWKLTKYIVHPSQILKEWVNGCFFLIILFVFFHFCKMLWNQCLTCYLDTNTEPQSLKEWDLSKVKSQKDSVGGNKGFPAAIRDLQSHQELIAPLPLSMGSISHRQKRRDLPIIIFISWFLSFSVALLAPNLPERQCAEPSIVKSVLDY